jgi:hypothetical protein
MLFAPFQFFKPAAQRYRPILAVSNLRTRSTT